MHEVAEIELFKIKRLTVLFSCIDKIKLSELDNDETDQPENL